MDDGPVAAAAEHRLSGLALDVACRAVLALPPHPALARPAWWDANAPARRITYVQRAATPLPPAPWPARRALDFCAELALALALVHEAGAAHGGLRPHSIGLRPDGGPLVHVPAGGAGSEDDLHGIGVLLLLLLTGRSEHGGLAVTGETGPAADAAALLQDLLAVDPAGRPDSARQVGERLAAIASSLPDTTAPPTAPGASRRRSRLAAALVLLVVAAAAGGYVVTHRVAPPGPSVSPATVTVPQPPAVTP